LFKEEITGALKHEIQISPNNCFLFDTIYIGGGTPSILDAEIIGEIIDTALGSFKICSDPEITVEVNPCTSDYYKFKYYKECGINRINIGVQSFRDINLKFLGRIHTGNDALSAVKSARKAGFDNIGIDLIYGIPGQSVNSWLVDLQMAVELEPEHLSCYMLTYESGTVMEKRMQKGFFRPSSDSLVSKLFITTTEFLEAHSYCQYEISNFARSENKRSKHNLKYWSSIPYMGIGPSAHSFTGDTRYWNYSSISKYLKNLGKGHLPIEGKELLTGQQQMIEAIYLGLRKSEGIRIDHFDGKFNISFLKKFKKLIGHLEEKQMIKTTKDSCMLTQRGRLFIDSIALMFI